MIIDDFRHGKAVSIEVRDKRVTGASVDPEQANLPGGFKITKAMRQAATFRAKRKSKPQVVKKSVKKPVILNGQRGHTHINLGLAILCSKEGYEKYGTNHTLETIAAFCGCSRQAIERIEKKAMRKVRAALYRDKTLEKDLKEMFGK